MKLFYIILVSLISNHSIAQDQNLLTQREVRVETNRCIRDHIIGPIFQQIFGERPEIVRIESNNQVKAYSKKGFRYFNRKYFEVTHLKADSANKKDKELLRIRVNDVDLFENNPYILKHSTIIRTNTFPQLETKRHHDLKRDKLGNQRFDFLGLSIKGIKTFPSQDTVFYNAHNDRKLEIQYNKENYIACLMGI